MFADLIFWGFISSVLTWLVGSMVRDTRRLRAKWRAQELEEREVPGDLLAELIEQRWLEACEVDPVQQALKAMDERPREREWKPLPKHQPPPPAVGQLWCTPATGAWRVPLATVTVFCVEAGGVLYRYLCDGMPRERTLEEFWSSFTYLSEGYPEKKQLPAGNMLAVMSRDEIDRRLRQCMLQMDDDGKSNAAKMLEGRA